MLVLERAVGEKVIVGDYELTVVVTRIGDGRVRLGFEAPPHIKINREEVLERIAQANHGKVVPGGS